MATLHQNERLLTALDAHTRASGRVRGGDLSSDAVCGEIRALNRLYDVSMECGMSHDEPVVEHWAAERVARFLVEA